MYGLWKRLEGFLDNLKIRRKLLLLYMICVIVPLVITDGMILGLLMREENTKLGNEMQRIAEAVSYELSSVFEVADRVTGNVYADREIDEFLSETYESPLDFYNRSRGVLDSTYYNVIIGYSSAQMYLYGDNETIVNGGNFQRLSSARDLDWYQEFVNSDKKEKLLFYYDDSGRMTANSQRKVSVIRKLNYFHRDEREKLLKLDLDYNSMNRNLQNMNFDTVVYVCDGNRILFSNSGTNKYTEPFEVLEATEKNRYEMKWSFYGDNFRILVEEPENMILDWIKDNVRWLFFLIGINVVLPWTIMRMINKSFVNRLQLLSDAFDKVEVEDPEFISEIQGTDEIAGLMHNYNRMLVRRQELIQIVYRDRLERQEMDLARQHAEIQALHSQINPHFLFNVLESIRMHSVLKGEKETAEMIARLAQLERQSVKWSSDYIRISEEIKFIQAYLELQKYRFGRRLTYDIQVMDGCEEYYLPRLSLSTFVENACVHGIEEKQANSWIYVRIYQKDQWLHLEVEDTGKGMSEKQSQRLLEQMRSCDISIVKESEHVGILNACLRLKMISDNMAEFDIESEKGAGCWFSIRIPTNKLAGGKDHAESNAGR